MESIIQLKTNIVDANSQWDDVKALRIRNYELKEYVETGIEKTMIGVIAQEVEEIFPSLVKEHPYTSEIEDDEGNIITPSEWSKNIQQVAFIPMLIKAVQELSAKVTAMENA